jgi:hypothetical protein
MAPKSLAPRPDHTPGVTRSEFAFFCWLRKNPDVAASYGIKSCNGKTTIGSMLLQACQGQGAAVEWYERPPQIPDDAPPNDRAAAWIKRVSSRPGQRLKGLQERLEDLAAKDHTAPPPEAAVRRRDGKAPRLSFPLIVALSHSKRRKQTSQRYNPVVAPCAVALVERARVVDFVETKLSCRCGARLRFDKRSSHQVACCAAWQFQCENSCKLPPLQTSTPLDGNDYVLNAKVNCAIITSALSFARMIPFLVMLGMRAPSLTDHYATKEEVEPHLAALAEDSMAKAHTKHVGDGTGSWAERFSALFMTVDGGFTGPRNAHGCTLAGHAPDGAVIGVVHRRLTDPGAKSSKGLETLCYLALICQLRVQMYGTTVMDGCRELIHPTIAAGKRAQADLWHLGKNWMKWAFLALCQLAARPKAPSEPENPRVEPVKVNPNRLEAYGERPKGMTAIQFARQRVCDLGGSPPPDATLTQLKQLFNRHARESVLTDAERLQEQCRTAYLAEKARREAAAKSRAAQGGDLSAARKQVTPWIRDLRSMLRYVAEYVRSLRGKPNPNSADGAEWTDAERGVEFRRLWRKGCVALVLGREDDLTLKLLNHPVAFPPGAPGSKRTTKWIPPGDGYVRPDSQAFQLLDSLICDPVWDNKFPGLIDGRMTFWNESFFHVLRKWGTKHSHFGRYYSIAIWCAVLSWNENVSRAVLEHVWKQDKSGQLKSSAGRKYKVAIRAPQTNFWMFDVWQEYSSTLDTGRRRSQRRSTHPMPGYALGWTGLDPPAPTFQPPPPATEPSQLRPVAALTIAELKAELTACLGMIPKGNKAELRKVLQDARDDLDAVREAQAPVLARTRIEYPERPMQRPSPSRPPVRTAANLSDDMVTVRPEFAIPRSYVLPPEQIKKRRAAPKGQKKWTQARVAAAVEDLAQGREVQPLKRAAGTALSDEPPTVDLTA